MKVEFIVIMVFDVFVRRLFVHVSFHRIGSYTPDSLGSTVHTISGSVLLVLTASKNKSNI